jgi:FlaA1/EpsC-like NDP-sugar epimerase
VIPLWREQIAQNQPVTITHHDATRYFISGAKAAWAILRATELPPGTYVPSMDAPERIQEKALRMGATRFEYVGLRPGEKMHEELFVGATDFTAIAGIYRDAAELSELSEEQAMFFASCRAHG